LSPRELPSGRPARRDLPRRSGHDGTACPGTTGSSSASRSGTCTLATRALAARLGADPRNGAGTGLNLPYYPAGAEIMACHLSKGMLHKAVERAGEKNVRIPILRRGHLSSAIPWTSVRHHGGDVSSSAPLLDPVPLPAGDGPCAQARRTDPSFSITCGSSAR